MLTWGGLHTHTHTPSSCWEVINPLLHVYDRTYYTGRVRKNFVPHHAQRVSLAVVKGEGDLVAAVANRLKADQVLRDMTPLGA